MFLYYSDFSVKAEAKAAVTITITITSPIITSLTFIIDNVIESDAEIVKVYCILNAFFHSFLSRNTLR
jgi:hypothetical protein